MTVPIAWLVFIDAPQKPLNTKSTSSHYGEGVLFVMGCAGYDAPRMKIGSGFKLRRHLFSREGGLDIL